MSKLLLLVVFPTTLLMGCESCVHSRPARDAHREVDGCRAQVPAVRKTLRPCYKPRFVDFPTCLAYGLRVGDTVDTVESVEGFAYRGVVHVGKTCMRDPACFERLWARVEVEREVDGVAVELGRRGGADALRSYRAMLRRLRGHSASPHLRYLAICGFGRGDRIRALGSLPVRVKHLTLTFHPAGEALARIGAAPGLESLTILDIGFDDCDARQLLRFPMLRRFWLYGPHSRLTGQGAKTLLQMPSMRDLRLRGAVLHGAGRKRSRSDVAIRRLRLEDSLLGDEFCALLHRAPIEVLRIPAEWRRCPEEGQKLSPTCWRTLQALTSVKRLDLSYRALKGLSFAGLGKLRQLRRMDIVSAQLSDEQIVAIARLPRLERLDLSNSVAFEREAARNTLGARGLEALSRAPRLRWLGLRGLRLRDRHMRLITRVSTLRHLDIWNNTKLTSRGIRALRALQQLESVHVPTALEQATRRLLPNVKQPDASWVR